MTARVLVNGVADAALSPLDRGLLYGDGLFETLRFVDGVAPLWERHLQRLREGCARLALPVPDGALLAAEAQRVLPADGGAVVRITVTRGAGQRGYAPPACAEPTCVVSAHPLPALDPDWYARGIRVRSCSLQLAAQPRLAGIKHLNRLEQVLARAEWTDPSIVEGLLCNRDGCLISATAANVFVVQDGVLSTPVLDDCGVAGVLRGALLEAMPHCVVGAVPKETLMRCDEMFLASSVRGVLPVRDIDGRALRIGSETRAAQACWHSLGFGGDQA